MSWSISAQRRGYAYDRPVQDKRQPLAFAVVRRSTFANKRDAEPNVPVCLERELPLLHLENIDRICRMSAADVII